MLGCDHEVAMTTLPLSELLGLRVYDSGSARLGRVREVALVP